MRGRRKSGVAGSSSSSFEAVQPPLPVLAASVHSKEPPATVPNGHGAVAATVEEEYQKRLIVLDEEGDECFSEEAEDEDKDCDQFSNHHLREEDVADSDRPKLAEGFYEIEAVRRRRIRKGQVQYLIKWRGWTEKANTWEPADNLQSCSDIIETFEQSFQSGKHRRRRRRSGVCHTHPTKQQQRSPATASYSAPVKVKTSDGPVPFDLLNDSYLGNEDKKNVEALNNAQNANQVAVDGLAMCSPFTVKNTHNELELKLSELKETLPSNGDCKDEFTTHNTEKVCSSEGDCPEEGLLRVDCTEPVQASRGTGAKRRKSGSVKRFRQDTTLHVPNGARTRSATAKDNDDPCNRVPHIQNPKLVGNALGLMNKFDNSANVPTIVEIIKTLSYSSSGSSDIQDVSVTFAAMSSEGNEVVVDNKYLKAKYPLMLIDFYEQRLRSDSLATL